MTNDAPVCPYNAKLDRVEHHFQKDATGKWWVCTECQERQSAEVKPLRMTLAGQIVGGCRT